MNGATDQESSESTYNEKNTCVKKKYLTHVFCCSKIPKDAEEVGEMHGRNLETGTSL